jgi:hypothetical protein
MQKHSISLLAVLLASTAADFHSDFDCGSRNMALEFAYTLQPGRPAAFFQVRSKRFLTSARLQRELPFTPPPLPWHPQAIADALNGTPEKPTGCSVEVPSAITAKTASNSRFQGHTAESFAARVAGGNTFWVDYIKGSDSNPGSESSPFKSISVALVAARAAPGWDTIVLRNGTHFLTSTIALGAGDAGLQITAFPGEEAWVSGAVPVTGITWSPYNVSNSPPAWVDYSNVTTIFACPSTPGQGGAGCPFLGTFQTLAACKAAAIAAPGITAYTWHDANQGAWANNCYGRSDGAWSPQQEAGHFSGHLELQPNVWSADLTGFTLTDGAIKGLRSNGSRLQRARFPNWNSEVSFGPNIPQVNWTPQWKPQVPDVQIDLASPVRNTTISMFKTYTAGVGGTCTGSFVPAAGYWCSVNVQGGGSQIWRAPIAMQATQAQLPHTPYANPRGGLIMTWRPGHWASWMMEIGDSVFNADTSVTNFSFAAGPFQGSRGEDGGQEVYMENIFEELDAPGEWFFNETTLTLYLWNNASGSPQPSPLNDGSIVAATLKHLFNVTGSQAAPVVDLSFVGIGLRDTSYTYMDPHGLPSGGDWSLERSAVVFAEGTEGLKITGCVFDRVDGNAVLLSSYNRNTTIAYNEFAWIGATAIAAWGNTYGGDSRMPDEYGLGQDGSAGDQPRGTVVKDNWVHDYAVYNKQSSFWTQFKSSENRITGNVGEYSAYARARASRAY